MEIFFLPHYFAQGPSRDLQITAYKYCMTLLIHITIWQSLAANMTLIMHSFNLL